MEVEIMTTDKSSETPSTGSGQAPSTGSGQAPERDKKQLSQSYWALVWWRFKRNRMGIGGTIIVFISLFVGVLFAEFFAPYLVNQQSDYKRRGPSGPTLLTRTANSTCGPLCMG
jgi:hypothetical protein